MEADFPWKGEPDDIACNLALGDLINNLPRRLTVNGRIHAETFITASGAIAGFAAQQAFFLNSQKPMTAPRGTKYKWSRRSSAEDTTLASH